ncbi:type II toxin-antitoxin system Phd/YefM family antitoxin [Nocardia sp. JW2]|uniref:type II toxin-antitoxin system Phd/YefM family antitoxin n=1 Tax=Nocardia sp. JW2 TaxID=3450738 RepID=UPI003F421D03
MSADAKVSGTGSDAELSPDDALEGFHEALQIFPRVDQQLQFGRHILFDFLSGSEDRVRAFQIVVRQHLDEVQSSIPSVPVSITKPLQRPIQSLFKVFSVREARSSFAELLNVCNDRDVMIVRSSKPAAVVLSYDRFEDLIDQIEDLQDQLSIARRENDMVSIEEAFDGLDD